MYYDNSSSLLITELVCLLICFGAPLFFLKLLGAEHFVATSGGRYPPGVTDGFQRVRFGLAVISALSVGYVASYGYMSDTLGNQMVIWLALLGIVATPVATFLTFFWRRYDSLAAWQKAIVWAALAPALGVLLLVVVAILIALAVFGAIGSMPEFGGGGGGGGSRGPRTAMGSDGRLYEKTGLTGGWKAQTSLLGGHQQDVDMWGNPRVKTGMFGGPVEARGPFGGQERGPEGQKLYERQ